MSSVSISKQICSWQVLLHDIFALVNWFSQSSLALCLLRKCHTTALPMKKSHNTGDFNFPTIWWSENFVIPSGKSEKIFCNALSDHYLSQVIDNPSRKSSFLNLLIISIPMITLPTLISLIPKYSIYTPITSVYSSNPPQKITITVYDYNCADLNEMNRTFQLIVFKFMPSDSLSNINDGLIIWRETFLAAANNFISNKTVKGVYHPPWLTGEILHIPNRKETLRRELKRDKSSSLLENYKNLHRTSKNLIS